MVPNSIYFSENGEVADFELMAYTISKLGSFEWHRTSMYNPSNIYDCPAGFYFRFHDENEVYLQLQKCIHMFKGKLKWGMNISHHTRHRNYIIEPTQVYEAKLSDKYAVSYDLKKVLKDDYESLCEKAILDIPSLCNHIEVWFELEKKRPFLPTMPE